MTDAFLGVDWKAFSILAGLLFAWTMLLVRIIAWLLTRHLGSYDDKIKSLEEEIEKEAGWRRRDNTKLTNKYDKLDGDFRLFLANLPKQYVQREDWLRTWTAVDAKMDSIWQSIRELIRDKKP
ncbi:MAG: hypothetical protein JKX72_02355 [Robiginitomaculum sp.]|nr:hypothetical protein [Robiginitomaculum sp.]